MAGSPQKARDRRERKQPYNLELNRYRLESFPLLDPQVGPAYGSAGGAEVDDEYLLRPISHMSFFFFP